MSFCDELFGEKLSLANTGWYKEKERYPPISDEKMVEAARRALDILEASGRRHVVALDTGAFPCAFICEEIGRREGRDLRWHYFKVPPIGSFAAMLRYHLSCEEWEEKLGADQIDELTAWAQRLGLVPIKGGIRGGWLELFSQKACFDEPKVRGARSILQHLGTVQPMPWQEAISAALVGTGLQKIFAEPLIVFDENMHRGSTMLKSWMCMQSFYAKLDAKLFVYHIEAKRARKFPVLLSTFYDKKEVKDRLTYGVYHYEDRMDYIGYHYFFEDGGYEKIPLETFAAKGPPCQEGRAEAFLDALAAVVEEEGLLEGVKSLTHHPLLFSLIDIHYCLRFFLYCLEERTGKDPLLTRYWYRVHYLYAPMSQRGPFLTAFWRMRHLFLSALDRPGLLEAYCTVREGLVGASARRFLVRAEDFRARMLQKI